MQIFDNEPQAPTKNDQDNSMNNQTNITNEPQTTTPVNSTETTSTQSDFMETVNGYLRSADQVADEVGTFASKYGNPVVEYTSKLANKFKELFHLT